jgi:hypothetical protein
MTAPVTGIGPGSAGHHGDVKTVAVAVVGGLLTLAGIALLVLPGPGFVLVAAGLAVLATRFDWARKPLDYARGKAQDGMHQVGRNWWQAAFAVAFGLALIAVGVLVLVGLELPFTNAFTAVVLILSGLFLVGTVVYARVQEKKVTELPGPQRSQARGGPLQEGRS